MSLAILYAGQGAQHKGMGRDLYEKYTAFAQAFDSACDLLDFDLHTMCFENPDGKLIQTQYTQPCMVAFAAGMTALLKENNIFPDYVAGLSLGEYSALEAAEVLTARDAISLTAFRGREMAKASRGIDCAMSAVLELDEETLNAVCEKANHDTDEIVMICNYNCPGQLVIGGQQKAVERAGELARAAGARRVLPLAVSGPFHTCFMKSAGISLYRKFDEYTFSESKATVMYNFLGHENNTDMTVQELLANQVQSPVRMESIIRRLFDMGVRDFIEVGPGHALTGFVKKTANAMDIDAFNIASIETADQFETMLSDRMLMV